MSSIILTYSLGRNSQNFLDFCRRRYSVVEYEDVIFDVIDSKTSERITAFTMKYNDQVTTNYQILQDQTVKMSLPKDTQFTIQIINVEGYVDGAKNTYTTQLLNGSHIGLTRQTVESDNAEFKLDWDINVATDLDSHMVVKNGEDEIGHVFYGNNQYYDPESQTSVVLDIDNVARSDQKPPEIISISKINPNYSYYYYVHDFSCTGKLNETNLNLNVVLSNDSITPPITIPTEPNANNYWNVCKIHNGTLTRASEVLLSTVTQEPNTNY